MQNWNEHMEANWLSQKVAILCARYNYRGVLSIVGPDYIVLSNACTVEISGESNSTTPRTEDPIGSSIIIMKDAIELVYQPNWSLAPLPGEDGYGSQV